MIDIAKLLATKPTKVGATKFIGIDGHGGSGKSFLANFLSEELGAEIIRTDDFASWDNLMNWDKLFVEHVFDPIACGEKQLNYKPTQWWDNQEFAAVRDQPVTNVMIIEGVGALRQEFREYISLGIFVDTPDKICLQRGIERDLADTGKTGEEVTRLWDKWIEQENEYFKSMDPKAFADAVVSGVKPFSEQIC